MLHPQDLTVSTLAPVHGLFSLDFVPALVVRTALGLDVFTQIGQLTQEAQASGSSFSDVSGRIECSPRGLKLILEVLVANRLLTCQDGLYALVPLAATFLSKGSPAYIGEAVVAQIDQLSRWWSLDQALRQGTTPFAPIEGDQDDGAFFGPLIQALFAVNAAAAKEVADWLPAEGICNVLDLGCGAAVWSLALALAKPQIQVTAVDRASVLQKVTQDCVDSFQCSERFQLLAGDFRKMKFAARSFDCIYLGHVLHNEGLQASQKLLGQMRKCLRKGGYLIVAEIVGADPPCGHLPSLLFDLNMLLFTQKGQVFLAAELEQMVQAAGFSQLQWLTTSSPSPILVAR